MAKVTPQPRVVVLLDVDGVLNADEPPYRDVWVDKIAMMGLNVNVTIGQPVIDAVRRWAHHPRVGMRWCTTWGEYANTHLAPRVGLPPFPLVDDSHEWATAYWKVREAINVMRQGIPLVWCDDQWVDNPQTAVEMTEVPASPRLLIAPQMEVGLTPQDLDRIDAFIAEHAGP